MHPERRLGTAEVRAQGLITHDALALIYFFLYLRELMDTYTDISYGINGLLSKICPNPT